jgi:hypothetical protein
MASAYMLKYLATSCARKRIPPLLPCTRPLGRMSTCIRDTIIEADQARIAGNVLKTLQGLCRPETLHAVRFRSVEVAHVYGVVTSGLSVLPKRLPPWKSERQSNASESLTLQEPFAANTIANSTITIMSSRAIHLVVSSGKTQHDNRSMPSYQGRGSWCVPCQDHGAPRRPTRRWSADCT